MGVRGLSTFSPKDINRGHLTQVRRRPSINGLLTDKCHLCGR